MALLLLAGSVQAEVIFDGWVQDGTPFEAGEEEIKVSFRRQNQMGTIFTASSTFLINRGDCETKDIIRYCLEDVDYERAVFEDGREYPMIHVRIESLEPSITVGHTYSTTTPRHFERIEAQATLQNTGELRADNVRLEIPLPAHVRVVSSAGTVVGNTIIFNTPLVSGQSKEFPYTLEARDLIDFTITPKLSYRFFDEQKVVYGEQKTISVKLPFLFDEELSDDGLKVGQTLTYNITIKNTAKRGDVDISSLTITVPSGLSVVSAEGITKEGRVYTFSDSLRKDEEHFITMIFQAKELGDHTIRMDTTLTAEGSTMQKTSMHDIKVATSDILPYLDIVPGHVRSDADFTLTADIKSKKSETIRGIITTISFDPPIIDTMRYAGIDLRGRQRASVVRREITAPQVDMPTNVTITLSGMYTDETGTFRFSTQGVILIEPFARPLLVSHRFNATPTRGDNVSLVTTVKNIGSIALSDVSVLDSIKGIKVVDGEPYFDGGLASGEEAVFSYSVYIPGSYTDESLEITTFMNANVDEEFLKIKTTESLAFDAVSFGSAVPAAVPSVENQPVGDEGIGPQERVKTEKKRGLFARLFAWILTLF